MATRFFNALPAAALLALTALAGSLRAASVELQPLDRPKLITIEHAPAWQSRDKMTFAAPEPASGLMTSGPLYVKIVYLDSGKGLLKLFYRSAKGMTATNVHTRSSRVDTGKFVASYHELSQPVLAIRGGNRNWLDLHLNDSNGVPLTIRSVTVQDEPFQDQGFRETLNQPWRQPLHFAPSYSTPAPTLKGRVMVGYQGWFRAPNDRDDDGWRHWFHSAGNASPISYTFDMWPDTHDYPWNDRVPAGDIKTRSGEPAYLFSSTSEAVVQQQFWWMRENHIDGAFLQRFLTSRKGGDDGTPEWVLMNVRKAANAQRRLWAVEYDVSGMPSATAGEVLKRDWTWLRDVLKVTDDPYYAHENGKPVVFVWGLPFLEHKFTPEQADQIVDFFQHDAKEGGNYVIGSLPNQWKNLPAAWMTHIRKCDGMQVWQSHDYAVDERMCAQWGIDYYPHVWPGFSWAHLTKKQEPTAFTDRAGGTFYRERISRALAAGCDRLFVGMFDEYDEGTAIMPMSNDPPLPGPPAGRFLTNGNDPPTRWLRITSEAEKALTTSSPEKVFDQAILSTY